MSENIIKFPFDVSRRAHARRPRWSKNGSPEERANARQAAEPSARSHIGNNPLREQHTGVSASVTIVGKVLHRRHHFDPSTLDPAVGAEWLRELCLGAERARYVACEIDKAIEAIKELNRHHREENEQRTKFRALVDQMDDRERASLLAVMQTLVPS